MQTASIQPRIDKEGDPGAVAAAEHARRLLSIDVMRGLTVAGMILVTDPGTYSAVYPPLLHAVWQGATPTDMIFPSFLFVMGASIALSTEGRLRRGQTKATIATHALRRAAVLVVLGLAVNGFPFYHWSTLRFPGILQRIAVCSLAATLLYLGLLPPVGDLQARREQGSDQRRLITLGAITAGILIMYWLLLRYVPVPGFGAGRYDAVGYLGGYIDRAVFSVPHLWAYGVPPGQPVVPGHAVYDPEGLLSTIPAFTNTLLGLIAGVMLRARQSIAKTSTRLAAMGLILASLALALSPHMPINKRIWTSTFALLSGGVSLLLVAALHLWLDRARAADRAVALRLWLAPVLVFGTNAILAFVISSVITASMDAIPVHVGAELSPLHGALHQWLFTGWLPPCLGSLAYALTIVAVNAVLLLPLYRRRIFLRL